MYEDAAKEIRASKPRMAICYDFDKTLSPDDMQTFTLIPSFGINASEFWQESNHLAKNNAMDKNLAWMYELIRHSKFKGKSLRREYFHKIGLEVPLYNGVEKWFDRITEYAQKKGIVLEHYIISSGLKEIIEGSRISEKFNRIYASSYYYDADGIAVWPTQAINYTNKTQYLFRIAKGILDESDDRVNDSVPDDQLVIPYENIVYIGDSETDIPCMRLVKSRGGYAIGVFDPKKNNRRRVYQLFADGRINFYAPANYTRNSNIEKYVKQIIDEISARETIKTEKRILKIPTEAFKIYTQTEQLFTDMEAQQQLSKRDKKQLKQLLENLKGMVEGNID